MSGLQLPDELSTGRSLNRSCTLSVCQTATYRWSLVEDLARYGDAGICGVGLYRPKVEEFEEELAIDLILSSGLNVSSLSWIGGLTGSDGSTQEEAVFDAVEALHFAAAVKAKTTTIVSGGSGRHILKHARRLLNDGLHRLCDAAEDLDQRLALHPFSSIEARGRTILTSLKETIDAIVEVNRPNLGMIFDVHELRSEPELLTLVPQVIPYVHCVRVSERRTRGERGGRHHDVCLSEILNLFAAGGYTGPFEFGLPQGTELATDEYCDFLTDCRSRFEGLGWCSEPSR